VFRIALLTLLIALSLMRTANATPFRFEDIDSLNTMTAFIKLNFSLESTRDELRKTFVDEGHATLKIHPVHGDTEKYIYDINLCHYYVWRWNISADYDEKGVLKQAYLNGNPIFRDGPQLAILPKEGPEAEKASVYTIKRRRPEADKGETALEFMLFDADSDHSTVDDQALLGVGPSRADPADMNPMVAYKEVAPWRSIFDADQADSIVPYHGDCAPADKAHEAAKKAEKP
jgi:hypothetical protein